MKAEFSILIAQFNNFKYFKSCFQSIKNQTTKNFEVIILDDFSTDGSDVEIKNLIKNDSRFKFFQNSENKGVGYTKKRLVELSTSPICAFLDPDDAITEDAIESSINAYKNENVVATYSKFYLCDENLKIKRIFPNTHKIKNNNPLFFNINFEVAHFFTFRKEIYLKTEGINENYKVGEDIDFYLKLYELGSFKFINKPLYFYRVHKAGLSHDESKIKLKNEVWHSVLLSALKRRNIKYYHGKDVEKIDNLPKFIFNKENTILKKLFRKL